MHLFRDVRHGSGGLLHETQELLPLISSKDQLQLRHVAVFSHFASGFQDLLNSYKDLPPHPSIHLGQGILNHEHPFQFPIIEVEGIWRKNSWKSEVGPKSKPQGVPLVVLGAIEMVHESTHKTEQGRTTCK